MTSTDSSADVAAEVRDRLADQPDVQVEPDARDVAGLLAAEQVAGAADLEVLHRDRHAGAELGVLGDRGQPVVGGLGQRLLRRIEEVGVAALAARPTRPRSWCSWDSPNMSARSTMSVLAFGMSRPDSTIVVETSTS